MRNLVRICPFIAVALTPSACHVMKESVRDAGTGPSSDGGATAMASAERTLTADGVVVTIPAGALTSDTALTVTVAGDAVVTVSPDIFLTAPATVRMDGARWPVGQTRIAEHLTDGEYYMIGPVTTNADGSWQYNPIEFSSVTGEETKLITTDLDAWSQGDVWENVRETTRTILPSDITRTDVTKDCLVNVALDIGLLHDPTTRDPKRPSGTRSPDEFAWMTTEAANALATARAAFKAALPGYDIWVNGAWDSSGSMHGAPTPNNVGSVHYFGAALDLAVTKDRVKVTDPTKLGRLPPLLLNAGFTWVWFEDERHVHASISSPSLSKCNAKDAGPEASCGNLMCADGCVDLSRDKENCGACGHECHDYLGYAPYTSFHACTMGRCTAEGWWDTRPLTSMAGGATVSITFDGVTYDSVDMSCCHDRGLSPNGPPVVEGDHTFSFSVSNVGAGTAVPLQFWFGPTVYKGDGLSCAYCDEPGYRLLDASGNEIKSFSFEGAGTKTFTARVLP